MAIEIAGIALHKIHKIKTLEQADFVHHRIPGLEGNVVQNMGRNSVRIQVEGIFYGAQLKEDLEALRKIYKEKEAVDFLAEIVGQAYFSQVILDRFEVWQLAGDPDQFGYRLIVAEYVPPPEPETDSGFGLDTPEVDAAIELEALDFMEVIQIPDLLAIPDFGDPTIPLNSVLEGLESSLDTLTDSLSELNELFG